MFLLPSFQNFRNIIGRYKQSYLARSSRRVALFGYHTGLFRSLVRLGFCWDMLRKVSGFYNPVFATSLLRSWGFSTFWLFCCKLFWYGLMFWSLAGEFLSSRFLARSNLVLYTHRVTPEYVGRRPFYLVPAYNGYGVDCNSRCASDLVSKSSSRVIVGRSALRFGVFTGRSLVHGTSGSFYRSVYAIRRVVAGAVRALWPPLRRSFWFRTYTLLRRSAGSRQVLRLRRRLRGLKKLLPGPVSRQYRFVRKFRALFTVRALHTNLFFTIRQGSTYFVASTGMFDDLKHGTKRKRTLLAGWFLADRLFERASNFLKEKTIFRVELVGRTSGRRGVWFSWRTKPWRLYIIKSRTPIAYNGTRGCRRRRL